jgi:hypothetical protein
MTAPTNPYSPPRPQEPYASMPAYEQARQPDVSEMSVVLLRQTRPWVMVMSIFSFLGSALMLFGSAAIFMVGALGRGGQSFPAALGLIYLPFALLYIYPGIKLWSYGSAIKRLDATRTVAALEDALTQQKSFWKFVGVLALAMVGLYALMFVAAAAIGIGTAMSK